MRLSALLTQMMNGFARDGITQRHIVADGELTLDMAREALQALQGVGPDGVDIDLIIVATTTPDDTFSTAPNCSINWALQRVAFDVQAVCAGFVYALDIADAMLRTGGAGASDWRGEFF